MSRKPSSQPNPRSPSDWKIVDKWDRHHCRTGKTLPIPMPYSPMRFGDLPTFPLFPRQGHAVSSPTQDGELYIFGGCSPSAVYLNDLWVYSTMDHSATLFQCCGEQPSPRAYASISVNHDFLIIWGGSSGGQPTDNSLYVLDLVSHLWTKVTVQGVSPPARERHAFVTVDSCFYIFGGCTTLPSQLNDIWKLDLKDLSSLVKVSASQLVWTQITPSSNVKPSSRQGHQLVYHENEDQGWSQLITFGGFDTSNSQLSYRNDLWSFNLETSQWVELQTTGDTPSGRQEYAATVVDDLVCFYGGSDGGIMGDFAIFDINMLYWHTFSKPVKPGPRYQHSIVYFDSFIYVLGGHSGGHESRNLDFVYSFNAGSLSTDFYMQTGIHQIEDKIPDGQCDFVASINVLGGKERLYSKFVIEVELKDPESKVARQIAANVNSDIGVSHFYSRRANEQTSERGLRGSCPSMVSFAGFDHFEVTIGEGKIYIKSRNEVVIAGDIIGGPKKLQKIYGIGTWNAA